MVSVSRVVYNRGDSGRLHCSFRLIQTQQNWFPFFFFLLHKHPSLIDSRLYIYIFGSLN